MVNWVLVVPIVVAIVPLVGVFGPVLISDYNKSLNTPSVDIVIKPGNRDLSKTIIELSNDGRTPATNLSLAVQSPENITSVTKKSGAADVILTQLPNNNQKLKLGMPQRLPNSVSSLELEIPRLVYGDGSLIALEISNNKSVSSPYTSAATYDQGSSIGKTEREHYAYALGASEFAGYLAIIFFIYYIVFLAAIMPYLIRWGRKRKNRLIFKEFISFVRDQIITVHSTIKMDPMTQHDFDDFIQTWGQKSVPSAMVQKRSLYDFIQSWRPKSYTIKKILDYIDTKDYIFIENLYAKLVKRISYLKRYSDSEDLKRYNNDSLKLVEKTLIDVDWKKYLN